MENKSSLGFIGQGYVGKNYSDDFERRGYHIVRYALEEPYRHNKANIKECDIVFIAVPTPTTEKGFDESIIHDVLGLIGKGKIAVVKSTILPGTTKALQKSFPGITILFSPEFLSEATAEYDAANPFANIVGMSVDDEKHRSAALRVHEVLPRAPFTLTCDSDEAEIIKYAHNVSGYTQIITFNLMYEVARMLGHNWDNIGKAISVDPLVCNRYANPLHKSGRGAGGHCFIKDFAALRAFYEGQVKDPIGAAVFSALEKKNITLLKETHKDLDLLRGVYGSSIA